MSGASTALSGVSSNVMALDAASTVLVGDNLTDGATFQAVSNLTGTATSVEDSATATVGGAAGALNSTVLGVNASDITVGNNAGTISATAASTLNATASTTGSAAGASVATASATQNADGLLDSAVSIGNDGNLTASATLVGTAAATNTGNVGTSVDDATAFLTLDSAGITQTTGVNDITIGDTGSVTANAFASGSGIAQTTNGAATSTGNLDATGLNLGTDNDITIGAAGNVSGLGVIGTLNSSGTLGNQVQITAATTDGIAIASGDFDATGILGVSTNSITAGPNDGDVRGQVLAGGNVLASSTGNGTTGVDDATATISQSDLFGIRNIDIVGGQVGTNSVIGTSLGDFDATATSVKGDSTASSDVNAYGIFSNAGTADTINVSGGISAIAQLSNTVTATSVAGNAIASATSDAVGLSGYNVTIIGTGTLNASATSNSQSIASSVGGRAGA
jgi:hypothetical protein